ncbi:hypothetical protein HAD_13424 [Hyphomonas adhaerens MHS-3]|uniref:Lipoprotein n=1 Tax=Hyphomonas adhaerens MHS-3 TaxID=1280949 RepID=A0A069E296_9PROT|nr:hypothetical protein [Hyphomonas adhaerens]KCZ83605.1 hypothetical protein HAD_13424 [Hyphomonas adhaerens MHS-3]
MSRFWMLAAIGAFGVCLASCAKAEPPEAMEEAATVQPGTIEEAAVVQDSAKSDPSFAELSPDDFDDPGMYDRLAFINTFSERLRRGAAVADMMAPTFFFVYAEQHECAGYTTGFEPSVPASDIDRRFMFPATFAWDGGDCDVPPDPNMVLPFHLSDTVSSWDRIDIEAVDANYTVFSLMDPSRHDYVLLNTEPSGDTYEITQIDYRWEFR